VITVAMLVALVFLTALLALLLLRRLLRPLVETTSAVKTVVAHAVEGTYTGRIEQRTSDEVGEIADHLNRLMGFLDEGITTISRRISELMGGFHPQNAGNQLVTATEMVVGLVEAAQFKQAIEEDQTKPEVYQRLARVLNDKYDFHQFSIYEVASSKNHITPIIVDNEMNAPCHWCDQQILIDANACRVRRTGHEVNAVDFPGICTMFRNEGGEERTHICLPITQSGSVGCVVQLVFPPDQGEFAKLLVPFIAVYLREASPVLEAKRLMEHLRESSLRDAMTGLYNRRFLEEYITTLVATSQRRKSPFSVLMLDLDYFKQVNDTFGHEAGDKVLKTLAEILAKSVRSSDMVVRYGGEEFLIVLMDTGAEDAVRISEMIRAKVEETKISLPGTALQKTISIGVSEFPADADTFWQVVKYADVALYEAKSTGRNRVIRFLPEMWKEEGNY
ncbi:MAG: GGDEF domain-containing protein, partial [Sulfuricella sp.]|nr:GGDEF domain-containing protein [Sulfuricella sp.]